VPKFFFDASFGNEACVIDYMHRCPASQTSLFIAPVLLSSAMVTFGTAGVGKLDEKN